MQKYRMLKTWKGFAEGDIVELDEDTAKALLTAEVVAEYDESAEKAKAEAEAKHEQAVKAAVAEAIEDALKNRSESDMRVRVEVTHEPEDDGFRSLGEQLAAVKDFAADGTRDKRFDAIGRKAASGANELIDSEGGFLVDPDIMDSLVTRMYETGMLVSRTRTVDVSGNGIVWRELQDYDRTSRPLSVKWVGEADDITDSHPAFNEREMRLRSLAGLYYTTNELDEDAPALSGMVESWFVREFGFTLDESIMNGNGAGKPLGYRNSGAIVQVTKESAQTADTIVEGNVSKMFSRMPGHLVGGAVWLINNDAWGELPGMTVGDQPVFLNPQGSIQEAPGGFLYGRPVELCEHCSTLGDAGDIQFVNLSEYLMIRKGMLKTDVSIHVRFIQGETAYRFVMRVNGQPLWSDKVTPYKGAASRSPFVELAARA